MIKFQTFAQLVEYFSLNTPFKNEVKTGDSILLLSEELNIPMWGRINGIEIDKKDKEWLVIHFRIFGLPMTDHTWKLTNNMIIGKEIFQIHGKQKFMSVVVTKPTEDYERIDHSRLVIPLNNTIH